MEYKIEHNLEGDKFEAILNSETIGVVNYTKKNDIIKVTHTGVISKYEGQGIAACLTKEVIKYVRNNNLKIIPICSYTKNYIIRHPEHQDLLP